MKSTIVLILIIISTNIFAQKYPNTAIKFEEKDLIDFRIQKSERDIKIYHSQIEKNNPEKTYFSKSNEVNNQIIDSLIYQIWSEANNQLQYERKEIYNYDTNKNRIQILYLEWDLTDNQWINSKKDSNSMSYNEYGMITLRFSYSWDSSLNQWTNSKKFEKIFNSNGSHEKSISYIWDTISQSWINNDYEEIIVGEDEMSMQRIDYYWDNLNNLWINKSKFEFMYDSFGNGIQYIIYNWDESSNKWINSGKDVRSFDDNNNMTQKLYFIWDIDSINWIKYQKKEFTYNSSSNLTDILHYNWDTSNSLWAVKMKEEYTYDINGDLTKHLFFTNNYANQWIESWKNEYNYDSNGNRIAEIGYDWNLLNDNWDIENKRNYFYSNYTVSVISVVDMESPNIFPNPFSENIQVNFKNNIIDADFELFDIHGQKVISKNILNGEKLNLE